MINSSLPCPQNDLWRTLNQNAQSSIYRFFQATNVDTNPRPLIRQIIRNETKFGVTRSALSSHEKFFAGLLPGAMGIADYVEYLLENDSSAFFVELCGEGYIFGNCQL